MNLDEAVAAAKAKQPDVELLQMTSASGDVVLRVPGVSEIAVFRKRSFDKDQRSGGLEALVRTCLVFPSREDFQSIINKRPMLIETWGEQLLDAAGSAEDVEVKKL